MRAAVAAHAMHGVCYSAKAVGEGVFVPLALPRPYFCQEERGVVWGLVSGWSGDPWSA